VFQPTSPLLLDNLVDRPTRGFLERVHPLWESNDLHRHTAPIRKWTRKAARSPFAGGGIVAASVRIDRAGMPAGYGISATAAEYASFGDCEEMAVVLAGRVGNPQIAPVPPVWPLLVLVLLEWRSTISAPGLVQRAAAMGIRREVQRGLVIVTYLFPELRSWLGEVQFDVPLWERVLAVPLAARKLVLLEKTN
jgi:hypothetical protein